MLHSSVNLDASAMEMVCNSFSYAHKFILGLRNRGVQKDLEDEQAEFIKNKLNNHLNNHNDYINWQASPYK